MAHWRERGYVPDSDDEEDNFSATASPFLYKAANKVPTQDSRQHDTNDEADITKDQAEAGCEDTNPTTTAEQLSHALSHGLQTVREILSEANTNLPLISDGDGDESPLSSLPSSLGSSPLLQPITLVPVPQSSANDAQQSAEPIGLPRYARNRSLRTRNPIQLHPYMLEDAKYRDLMRGRGLKPINIPGQSARSLLNAVEDESLGTDHLPSTQVDESFSFEVPSSPPGGVTEDESQSPIFGGRRLHRDHEPELDDDLPELSQLLHQTSGSRTNPHKITSSLLKRPYQKNTLTISSRISGSSAIQDGLDQGSSFGSNGFQVPPSPPRSDSVEIIDDDDFSGQVLSHHIMTPAGLPTPLISSDNGARKRNFALAGSVTTSSASASSDESENDASDLVQQGMQNMTRRIRGVLPASWLKLDMKKTAKATKATRIHPSPSKGGDDRGIAHRISSKRKSNTQTARTLTDPPFEFGLDEESDDTSSDAQHQQSTLDLNTLAERMQYSLAGEAEEDNEIDRLLPTQTRSRKLTQQPSRKKQTKLGQRWKDTTANLSRSNRSEPHYPSKTKHHTKGVLSKSGISRKRQKLGGSSPTMDVLDAPMLYDLDRASQPKFLRIAARQARNSILGIRPSKTRKFFKFPTMQDTQETNEIVRQWKPLPKILNCDNESYQASFEMDRAPSTSSQYPRDHVSQRPDHMQSLKESTNALLQRISRTGQNTNELEAKVPHVTDEVWKLSGHVNSVTQLKRFFPHHNRSGKGHLVSRLGVSRPAQIEGERSVTTAQPSHVSQRIPRKLQTISSKQSPLSRYIQDQSNQHQSFSTTDTFDYSIGGTHKSADKRRSTSKRIAGRKQQPRKLQSVATIGSAKPQPAEAEHHPTGVVQIIESSAQDAASVGTDNHLLHAIRIMRDLLQHNGSVVINSAPSALISLQQSISRATNTHVYTQDTRRSTTNVHVLSTHGRVESLGQYDSRTRSILDESQKALLDAIHTWDYQSSLPITAIEDMVSFTEDSLCFGEVSSDDARLMEVQHLSHLEPYSPGRLGSSSNQRLHGSKNQMSARMEHCIKASTRFIDEASRLIKSDIHSNSVFQLRNGIKIMNYFMIYALQTFNIADKVEPLQALAKKTCFSAIQQMLDVCLTWTDLQSLFATKSVDLANVLDPQCTPAVEGIVIAWHICEMLCPDDNVTTFYDLVASSLSRHTEHDPVSGLSFAMVVLLHITRCTSMDLIGLSSLKPESNMSDINGWNCFVNLIPKAIACLRHSEQHVTATVSREYLGVIIDIILRFVQLYHWKPSPSLVKMMLEIYSFNEMVPFKFNGDANTIFYDHQVIDRVPEAERNDFDHFLVLVQQTIDLQQLFSQIEARQKTSAKELRGLIYSLIPNNAQLYDARKELHAEQFLSLKNHFALYVALYRSSPEGYGPRIQQLEQQVNLEYSHLMVCRLALKAWETITSFEVNKANPSLRTLEQIGFWLDSMLNQLTKRQETGQIDAKSLYEEALHLLRACLASCSSSQHAWSLMSPVLNKVKASLPPKSDFGSRAGQAAFAIFKTFADKTFQDRALSSEIGDTLYTVKGAFQAVLQSHNSRNDILKTAAASWFGIARASVHCSKRSWHDFIEPRSPLSIDQMGSMDEDVSFDVAKSVFLVELIKSEEDSIFLEYRSLIYAHWIKALLSTAVDNQLLNMLTHMIIIWAGESLQLHELKNTLRLPLSDTDEFRFPVIRHVIRNIYLQQDDLESEWLAGGLEEQDLIELLRVVSNTMKRSWKALQQDPVAQNHYTAFVEAVINEMETYPLKGFRLDHWFSDGKEFPRASPTFDNIFRCRFGAEGGDVVKSSIVTLRMKLIEAVAFNKQGDLSAELARVFCCTDTLRVRITEAGSAEYSVDLTKQTRYLRIVGPIYIEQARTLKGALVIFPLMRCLYETTANVIFRVDNMERTRMVDFVDMSVTCLGAVASTLENNLNNPATSVLLEYASIAVQTIWQLMGELDMPETLHMTFGANIIRIASAACSMCGKRVNDVDLLLSLFSAQCSLRNMEIEEDKHEKLLRDFASRDLQEGLQMMSNVKPGEIVTDPLDIEERARNFVHLFESLPLLPLPSNVDDIDLDSWYQESF